MDIKHGTIPRETHLSMGIVQNSLGKTSPSQPRKELRLEGKQPVRNRQSIASVGR